jgi:hypothetical protein
VDINLELTLLGIAISVVFGIIGVRSVRKYQQSQKQKVTKGSIGIQSGRDSNIGSKP